LPHGVAKTVIERLRSLNDDDEFWQRQSRSLVVLASPDVLETFRLANELEPHVAVGDRFDTGSLLRAVALPHRAFVVGLTEHHVGLIEFGPDHRPVPHELDLPDDHRLMLQHTTTDGQFDRQRADGATGDRPERRRFAAVVQDQVSRTVPDDVPLILAAATDLAPAYREVNSHPMLLTEGIAAHPESLEPQALSERVRAILDDHYAAQLDAWREQFGTLRSQGLATSRFAEVAAAAAAAAIDT